MKIRGKEISNNLIIGTSVIVVVTLFIGIVFIYMPFAKNKKTLSSEVSMQANRNLLINKIVALRKLELYRKRVSEDRDASWLLEEVSNMASESKVEVSSIEEGSPEDRGLYKRLYVTVDTYSTYHQLGVFLSKIESQEDFIRVEELNMKRLDMEEGFEALSKRYKPFDVKASIVIATVALKE